MIQALEGKEERKDMSEMREDDVLTAVGDAEVQDCSDGQSLTFLQRLNRFRADVQRCDWSYDKYLTLAGNRGYPYISSDKCRRNMAPLLVKHGFELVISFSELTRHPGYGNATNHWTVRLDASLKDVITGEMQTSTVYGEAGDSGDKGLAKAQTAAIKQWILTTQLLAEGMDPDVDSSAVPTGSFQKRTPEETEEVRSKVLEHGLKPSNAPAEPRKPVKREEPKEVPKEVPKEIPVETSKEPEPAQGEERPESGDEERVEAVVPEGLSNMHKAAIQKIVDRFTEGAKHGVVGPSAYNIMSADCASIKDAKDAVAFIKKYKEK